MYEEASQQHGAEDTDLCPVCGASSYRNVQQLTYLFICPRCGKYRTDHFTISLLADWRQHYSSLIYKASHQLRETAERARRVRDNSLFPVYKQEDFKNMLESPDLPVREKMNLLIKHLGEVSIYPGADSGFDLETDYPVLQAKNDTEADFYVRALVDQGLVTVSRSLSSSVGITLTAAGWIELQKMAERGGDSANAFIAMSFDASRDRLEEAINRAILAAGYLPVRVDRVEHVNRIDDEIIARIRDSKFMVADFTGQKNGVYFEAGFMLGLGRTVIWLCDKSDLQSLHFDARQYNMINYVDAADLEQRLKIRIEAILGKGPQKLQGA